jgi:glycosyltransferase involved in cell wall biosynthesis
VPLEPGRHVVIVTARNEADRIADTVTAIREAFTGARVVVADGGSDDDTAERAAAAGAELVRAGTFGGKGRAATIAAERALESDDAAETLFIFCDGDLGRSAARLGPLSAAIAAGECDIAVAAFARRQGGGFGIAVGFARRVIRLLVGLELRAPISGQRAMRAHVLRRLLPFAPGFGIEIGMTVDAARAGFMLREIEIDLEHRATGRDAAGFLHRGRQLGDFARVYLSRRYAAR